MTLQHAFPTSLKTFSMCSLDGADAQTFRIELNSVRGDFAFYRVFTASTAGVDSNSLTCGDIFVGLMIDESGTVKFMPPLQYSPHEKPFVAQRNAAVYRRAKLLIQSAIADSGFFGYEQLSDKEQVYRNMLTGRIAVAGTRTLVKQARQSPYDNASPIKI